MEVKVNRLRLFSIRLSDSLIAFRRRSRRRDDANALLDFLHLAADVSRAALTRQLSL